MAIIISSGDIESGIILENDTMIILDGGVAATATVNANGEFSISSGGLADNTTINNGGRLFVSTGGVASFTTVNEGGVLHVSTGGKYAYTTKTDKGGNSIAVSTSMATGKLSISSAEAAEDAMFAVEGFKDVSIDITGEGTAAPFFTGIIGGTETAQFTNSELDYSAYDVSGTLNLATAGGSVNYIAGFKTVNLKDTDAGIIVGYSSKTEPAGEEWEETVVGKASVTFENTAADGNTVAAVDNARSVTFKAANDLDADFYVGSISSSENVDIDVLIEKCQTSMDFQYFSLNDGDEIKLTSAGTFGDGTWATILLEGLTEDSLDAYFDNIEGTVFSGKGTLMAAVTEDQFKQAADGKVGIGKDIAFQSLLA